MVNQRCFTQRMYDSGLSYWELGDLLGLHPHDLHLADHPGAMNGQPVQVVAELAARLDMHPADLADALDPVLGNHRTPAAAAAPRATVDDEGQPVDPPAGPPDVVVLLSALATSSVPLGRDDLATALNWTLDRVDTAIQCAVRRPDLAGPLALRQVPPQRWSLTARHDILTSLQRRALTETARYREPLDVEEATVLLSAYRDGPGPNYRDWRLQHLPAETALKASGLLHSHKGPHRVDIDPDVRYGLEWPPDPAPAAGSPTGH